MEFSSVSNNVFVKLDFLSDRAVIRFLFFFFVATAIIVANILLFFCVSHVVDVISGL